MKHKNCTVHFSSQRDRELMNAYRSVLAQKKFFDFKRHYEEVVNQPCSRFWVSEERATAVISDMIKGRPVLDSMLPNKREMFTEIYRRVIALQKQHPDYSIYDLTMLVVNAPAPKFYLNPNSAMVYIYCIKKKKTPPLSLTKSPCLPSLP